MASTATIGVAASINDATKDVIVESVRASFTPLSINGKRETVSLTGSAFTALTVPSGAKAVLILCQDKVSLTLKGVTGDTGIAITPASSPVSVPVLVPLGATPSIGILNGGSTTTVEVVWF